MTILKEYSDAINIIEQHLAKTDRNIVISIDGRCCSGKTTFSALIKSHFNCNVIHIDDFFLQPHQRTHQRLNAPGGNFDIERFSDEVIKGIRSGESFSYRPFDCKSKSLAEPITLNPSKLTVIEGSYSRHPEIAEIYDITFFITTDYEKQKQRILIRNKDDADTFFNKWIPLEEKYFLTFEIEKNSNYVIRT